MFQKIKIAWNGEERLWKVFWLWGVTIYLSVIPIGSFVMVQHKIFLNVITSILVIIVGVMGLIFAFIYPVIFCVALWRCAKNTDNKIYSILGRSFVPLYVVIHVFIGGFTFFGGGMLIWLSLGKSALTYPLLP